MHASYLNLIHLRQELEHAEKSFKQQRQLLQERTLLDSEIATLQEQIEQDSQFLCHQTESPHFSQLETALNEKKAHLKQLKKTCQQLDDLLDQTDELTEDQLADQQEALLMALWQVYPDQRPEQEAKWQERKRLELLEADIQVMAKILEKLHAQFALAIQARLSIKGRGLLNYIFGISPNMIIEQQLLSASSLIQSTLPLIEKMHQRHQTSADQAFFKELAEWLDHLKISCQSPWGFHHLDTVFTEAKQTLETHLDLLKKSAQTMANRRQALANEIKGWIDDLERTPLNG